ALAANEKVSAKAECLGLMAHVLFARFCAANLGILVCGSCASIYSGLPSQKLPCLLKISSVALSLQ
ncbi:hypothetical protein, partial [Vibrio parahaemolyticus]|uniref:hypothetical protein n=1 Tax=Vibrio parahaemolyticus TaxID=670 RepID=UPI001173AC84